MDEIENWGNSENQIMKGYVIWAFEHLMEKEWTTKKEYRFSKEDLSNLLVSLSTACDEMTAQQAHDYYVNSKYF